MYIQYFVRECFILRFSFDFLDNLNQRIFRAKGELNQEQYVFFLTGGVGLENTLPNPDPTWLSEKSWDEICRLNDLEGYSGFR